MATIKKQSNGTYKISVSLGYDINHKQIRKTMTFTPEKGLTPKQEERAVQREAVLFEDKCRSGKVMQGSIRFAEFAEMWLKDRQSVLRPTTYARYKPLAPKTVLHYHRLISVIYSTAVDWEVVASNPCERTKPPKVGKPNPKYLDEKQAAKMLDMLEYESMDYRTMIRILLFLGMRRSEFLGLNWSDIDFEHETMQIEKSSLYLADRGIFEDDVKNSSSERVIKIPLIAVEDLREYREWQTERCLQMGDRWHYECDRIFTNEVGLPLHPDTLSGWFKDFISAHSDVLPPITLHSLRHTNATLQIAGGVPIITVSMRLGHANTATTAKIYAHAIKSADAAAAETINDVFVPNIERTDKGTDKKPDTKRQ